MTSEIAQQLDNIPQWKLAYTIDEAIVATHLGRTALFERIKEGKITARHDGRITFIERTELERYLKTLPVTRDVSTPRRGAKKQPSARRQSRGIETAKGCQHG